MSWKKIPWTVVLPLVFVVVVFALSRVGVGHEYDEDEGMNLMKGLLVARGHALYSEVWDDQPPGLTYLLAGVFKVVGPSVFAGRVVVLGFSAVLLWALGEVLRVLHGRGAAVAGMLLLMGSYFFARLSFSVMIGLPAVALGMVSLWLVVVWRVRPGERRTGDFYLLLLSAVVFAMALLTKMFVVAMAPGVLGVMLVPGLGKRKSEGGRLRGGEAPDPSASELRGFARDESSAEARGSIHEGTHGVASVATGGGSRGGAPVRGRAGGWVVAWGVMVMGLFGLGLAGAGVDFSQTVGTHLRAEGGSVVAHAVLGLWARRDWDLILLGVGAVVWGWMKRDWRVAPAAVWAVVAVGALLVHRPVWYHHVLLASVPLAWLGGIVVGEEMKNERWRRKNGAWGVRVAVVGVLVGYGGWAFYKSAKPLIEREDLGGRRIVEALRAGGGEWVVSDRPMDVFRAGKMVPPEVAVLSLKRVGTTGKAGELVMGAIGRYRPGRVEIGRLGEAVRREVLGAGYREILSTRRGVVYGRDNE